MNKAIDKVFINVFQQVDVNRVCVLFQIRYKYVRQWTQYSGKTGLKLDPQ